MKSQIKYKIGILGSILVLVSACNGGGTNVVTPASNAAIVKSSVGGYNVPDHGGSAWAWVPWVPQYAGHTHASVTSSSTIVAPILATANHLYALELVPNTTTNEVGIQAYNITAHGEIGTAVGTLQNSGTINANYDDGLFNDDGDLVAMGYSGKQLYVLNTGNKSVSIFRREQDGSVSGNGSNDLMQMAEPVSIATVVPDGNNEYVVAMDKKGALNIFKVNQNPSGGQGVLSSPAIYAGPAVTGAKSKFTTMAITNKNIFEVNTLTGQVWTWSIGSSGSFSLNSTPSQTGLVPVSAVVCNNYLYVLNRGNIGSGKASISYYQISQNGSIPAIPTGTYSDGYGDGYTAKALRTDGTNVFVYYANSSNVAGNNLAVSYQTIIGGGLSYIKSSTFGQYPMQFISEMEGSSSLNYKNFFAVDLNPSKSTTSVGSLTKINGKLYNIQGVNVLANYPEGSVVKKMVKYNLGGNYLFFLIKNQKTSNYSVNIEQVIPANGSNSIVFSTISTVTIGGKSKMGLNNINSFKDMMIAGNTLYILGTDKNGNEQISNFSIAQTSGSNGSDITLTDVSSNNVKVPTLKLTDTDAGSQRFIWNPLKQFLYVLVNNNALQVFSYNNDGSLTYKNTVNPPVPYKDFNDAIINSGNRGGLYWRPGKGAAVVEYTINTDGTLNSAVNNGNQDFCGTFAGSGYSPFGRLVHGSATHRTIYISCQNSVTGNVEMINFGSSSGQMSSNLGNNFFTNGKLNGSKLAFISNNNLLFVLDHGTSMIDVYNSHRGNAHNHYVPLGNLRTGTTSWQAGFGSNDVPQDIAFFNPGYVVILTSGGSLILYYIRGWYA